MKAKTETKQTETLVNDVILQDMARKEKLSVYPVLRKWPRYFSPVGAGGGAKKTTFPKEFFQWNLHHICMHYWKL